MLVELFVGVLGASSLTYVEATRTQRLPDWIASNQRMYRFMGGVSRAQVPDQQRSAVRRPEWYEPGINRTYEALSQHYGTSVFPARPGKPKDKAKVEVAVQIAQRWILARLRNETFFSLAALNARIRELNGELNDRPMKRYGDCSRRELFERLERITLLPLPETSFELAEWSTAKVHLDYHVQVAHHYYSVLRWRFAGRQPADSRQTAGGRHPLPPEALRDCYYFQWLAIRHQLGLPCA